MPDISRFDGRMPGVDALRGIAALSVLWFHLTNGDPALLADGPLKASGSLLYAGVAAFFVISGLVIPLSLDTGAYRIGRDGPRFILRRLARLHPPYAASLLLTLLLFHSASFVAWLQSETAPRVAGSLALHLLYLPQWFGVAWINPVYWTLAIEFQFYLAMLVGAGALLSHARWLHTLTLGGCLLLSLLVADERVLACYLPLFGMGFLLFLRARRGLSMLEAAVWAAAFCLATERSIGAANAIFGLATLIALTVPWPRTRLFGALGAISYSLYLVQVPVCSRVLDLAPHLPQAPWVLPLLLGLAVAAALGAATAFWALVERPSIAWSRRIAARERVDPSEAW